MFWILILNVCFISHCKFASSHIKEGLIMEQDPESRESIENFTTDYKIIRTLGRGRFSVVKMAYHVPTLTCVAIKVLKNTKKCSSVMSREVDILKSLGHPHIIKVVEVVQTREATHLVMEHASQGDLLDRIRECGYLKSWEARRMFRQILEAVQFCHDNNIVHRDIKANNILIDGRSNAKLCDFGLAAKTLPGQKLIDFCGTLPYCAPEFFEAEEYEGRPFDVWSVGVLLFFMVTGHLPFLGKSFAEVRRQISSANFSIPPHVANDIFNVIVEMLMINPSRRPSIQQIVMRPMIKDSQAYSPPTSIQTFTGTPSPSIIKAMRVMRHTPEKSTESLIDQNINEVLATYLIQQHKPLRKVCTHHQVEPGLEDHHSFPRFLKRKGPLLSSFTLSSNSSNMRENEDRKNSRKVVRRHDVGYQQTRTNTLHLDRLDCPIAEEFKDNRLQNRKTFSDSKTVLSCSLTEHIQSPRLQYTYSTTADRNVSSFIPPHDFCASLQTPKWISLAGCSGDTWQRETLVDKNTFIKEEAMVHEDTVTSGQPQGILLSHFDQTLTHPYCPAKDITVYIA
ncbi:sperm motility kinase X-like [Rattus norvegicus]|uniref:sperm motility kinase X-like n=1 Tax=Rattus norvegicus TaxID=10116 RepID=UPI002FD7D604